MFSSIITIISFLITAITCRTVLGHSLHPSERRGRFFPRLSGGSVIAHRYERRVNKATYPTGPSSASTTVHIHDPKNFAILLPKPGSDSAFPLIFHTRHVSIIVFV